MSEPTATADAEAHGSHEEHEKHLHPDSHYTTIAVVLMVLALVSFIGPEIGGALDLPIVTLITAFGIAFVKAWLVMKHFMHLDVEKPIVHYFLATAVVFMVLFFAGVAPDVGNHEGKNWENVAAKEYVDKQLAIQAQGGDGHGHGGHGDHGGHEDTPSGEH